MALLQPVPHPLIASISSDLSSPSSPYQGPFLHQLPPTPFANQSAPAMTGLKRKRSDTLTPDSSFGTTTTRSHSSSPPRFPHPWAPLSSHSPKGSNYSSTSDLNSRTRKRVHSRPPDQTAIHENTYNLLFSAANPRSPASARTPSTTHTRPSPPHPQPPAPRPRQSSLHTFWTLPSLSPPIPQPSHNHHSSTNTTTCQDCDAPLLSSLDEDIVMDGGMMDIDSEEAGEFRCRGCERVVCKGCAVVEVGGGRECLMCRTSVKRWIGGIGWMS